MKISLIDFAERLKQLERRLVVSKTIGGNSIWIWFDDDQREGVHVPAPWRLLGDGRILGTSAEFPWEQLDGETDAEYELRCQRAWARTDAIEGKHLQEISIDVLTSDLHMQFEGGMKLSSFTVWTDEENWSYIDRKAGIEYWVSVSGVEGCRIAAR